MTSANTKNLTPNTKFPCLLVYYWDKDKKVNNKFSIGYLSNKS